MPATTTLPRRVRAVEVTNALPARGSRESGHSRRGPLRAARRDELLRLDDVPLQLPLGPRGISGHQVVHDLPVEGDGVPRQGLRRARFLPHGLHDVDDGPDQQRVDGIPGRLGQEHVEVEVLLDPLLGLVFLVEALGTIDGGGEAGQLGATRVLYHGIDDQVLEGEPDLGDVPELEVAEAQEIAERPGDGFRGLPPHERASAVARPDANEARLLEDPVRLPDGAPPDLELADELALRRQSITGPKTTGEDGVPDVLDDPLEDPGTAKRAEG